VQVSRGISRAISAGFLVLCVGLMALLLYRYFSHVPLPGSTGLPSPSGIAGTTAPRPGLYDFSPREMAEMDNFARAPRFRAAYLNYAKDRELYTSLTYIPIQPAKSLNEASQRLKAVLPDRLSHYDSSRRILEDLPPDVVDSLAEHLALLLQRSAGLPNGPYLRLLGSPNLYLPWPYGRLTGIYSWYLPTSAIPSQSADATEVRQSFDTLEGLFLDYRSGSNDVIGFSTDENGLFGMLADVPSSNAYDESIYPLNAHLTMSERLYYQGWEQGTLVYTKPAGAFRGQLGGSALRSEVYVIVHTKGNDMYPICFNSLYDSTTKSWRLLYANRTVSLRMAASPPLIF